MDSHTHTHTHMHAWTCKMYHYDKTIVYRQLHTRMCRSRFWRVLCWIQVIVYLSHFIYSVWICSHVKIAVSCRLFIFIFLLSGPNGQLVPAQILQQPDGDYKVEYSSKYTGTGLTYTCTRNLSHVDKFYKRFISLARLLVHYSNWWFDLSRAPHSGDTLQ